MANFERSGPERSNRKSFNVENEFSKEKTVLISCVLEGSGKVEPDSVIDEIELKCGRGSVIACVPKTGSGYEVVFRERQMMEPILGDLSVSGKTFKVTELESSFRYVSILNLSMYVTDAEIIERFSKIGVEVVSPIKKHKMKSKNYIYDGTRVFKAKLPPNMKSIPYSMKFSVNEKETAYYRVIHNHQVRVCHGCFSPDHIYKDCPDFKCFECGEQGHISRKCLKNKCSFCFYKKENCKCETLRKTGVGNSCTEFQTDSYSGIFKDHDIQHSSDRMFHTENDDSSDVSEDDEWAQNTRRRENVVSSVHSRCRDDVSHVDTNGDATHTTVEAVVEPIANGDNGVASHITDDVPNGVASQCIDECDGASHDGENHEVDGDDVSEVLDDVCDMVHGVEDIVSGEDKEKVESEIDHDNLTNNVDVSHVNLVEFNDVSGVSENNVKDIDHISNIENTVSSQDKIKSQGGVSHSTCDTLDDFEMDTHSLTSDCQLASGDEFTVVGKKKSYLGIKRRNKFQIKPNLKAARLSNVKNKLMK